MRFNSTNALEGRPCAPIFEETGAANTCVIGKLHNAGQINFGSFERKCRAKIPLDAEASMHGAPVDPLLVCEASCVPSSRALTHIPLGV